MSQLLHDGDAYLSWQHSKRKNRER